MGNLYFDSSVLLIVIAILIVVNIVQAFSYSGYKSKMSKQLDISDRKSRNIEERYERALKKFCTELNFRHRNINNMRISENTVSEMISALRGAYISKEREVQATEKNNELRNHEYEKMLRGNLEAMPYLAGMIADYLTYDIEVLAKKLDWGANQQREKKVKDIREIRRDARERIEAAKEAEYQMAYLLELYPELSEIIETDYKDLYEKPTLYELHEIYDETKRYLTMEEWNALNPSERNQLALDRYIESRKKSKWQIGRDYELYVAYSGYKQYGWETEDTGIKLKLEDMGRDIIAKNGNNVQIVQCKYWSKDKTIHEKHIFQLYGTAVSYKLDHEGEGLNVKPVFVTNIDYSDTAKKVAKALGVQLISNYPMGEFPRIKCNIGKDKNKIYHLPMDQQYDSVIINPKKGEFEAMTVEEAEAAGFRRAFKWHGAKL